MTDTKISALTDGSPAQSGDEIPAARSGTNVRITAGDIAALATSTPSDFQPAIVTGNYYFGPFGISEADGNYGSGSLVAMPFWASHDAVFTRIGASVAAPVAASTLRLGIYDNDNASGNVPGSLILDAGTISSATSGAKEITISYSYTANTLIWLVSETDDLTNLVTFMVDTGFGTPIDLTPHRLGITAAPVHQSYGGTGLTKAGAYMTRSAGALPATFTVSGRNVTAAPAVWLRKV